MRKLVYYVAASIDGYIAGPRGEFDFYTADGPDRNAEFIGWIGEEYPETLPTAARTALGLDDRPHRRFDTVLSGLATYRIGFDAGAPSPYAHLRQYVVSRSLPEAPDPAVTLARDPLALVGELKQETGGDIWLCGGGKLAGALLPEIDELIVKTYPVLAGTGVPMVDGAFDPTRFAVTARRSFPGDVGVTWWSGRSAGTAAIAAP
jgi:dihydrofolate reductase